MRLDQCFSLSKPPEFTKEKKSGWKEKKRKGRPGGEKNKDISVVVYVLNTGFSDILIHNSH